MTAKSMAMKQQLNVPLTAQVYFRPMVDLGIDAFDENGILRVGLEDRLARDLLVNIGRTADIALGECHRFFFFLTWLRFLVCRSGTMPYNSSIPFRFFFF